MSIADRIAIGAQKVLDAVNPEGALRREAVRKMTEQVRNYGYSHHGASVTKSNLVSWRPVGTSPEDDIDTNQPTLRARNRDLYMSSSLARGAIDTLVTNVAGPGLMMDSEIDHECLGISHDEAARLERQIEREWRLWAGNEDCSLSRSLTFAQAQTLILCSSLVNGDVFVAMPTRERKGRAYSLKINIIESDLVSTPLDRIGDDSVKYGIRFDDDGAPVEYYVSNCYPYGAHPFIGNALQPKWTAVPAFGRETGRRNILHIMAGHERPGQIRGVPILSPVIEDLKQLTRYAEAEVTAAVLSAYFTVFITSETPNTPLQPQIRPGQQLKDNPVSNSYEMAPGAIIGLKEGEKIETADPGRPNTAFEPFTAAMMRQIGAGLGIPYEILIKHFSSSYSASRGAKLEAVKKYAMLQEQVLISQFCRPVFEEFLAEAVARGRIRLPGFFEDPATRAAWSGSKWYGLADGQLDPLKEAKAAKVLIDEGLSTRSREAARLSGDTYENIHAVRVREERMRREGGLLEHDERPERESDEDI